MPEIFAWAVLAFFGGGVATLFMLRLKHGKFEAMATEIVAKGEEAARVIERKKVDELKERTLLAEKGWMEEREKLRREEEKLEKRAQLVDSKALAVEKKEAVLEAKRAELEDHAKVLERISGMSQEEARAKLLEKVELEVSRQAAQLTRRKIQEAEREAEKEAGKIIATAINRLSSVIVSESTVVTVAIPNEELKGRIIGREGRNIRALEQLTGVNFVIDDTPGAVVLSSFDPVRRHIAKVALSDLIADGRIHPTRIEEAVERATERVQKEIQKQGEDAAWKVGVLGLHPELIKLLGKLSFRYSYGQNILEHSVEVAHLMGLMAAELDLDQKLAKRIGLLHDIGKALSHEIPGSHALVGHDYALKYGESLQVAVGIGCHHQEMKPNSVEGSLCSSADALSGARPGARIEAVEEYVKRIRRLEDLAYEFPGVTKAYVLQAGRELRIIVLPSMIDDDGLTNLARDLTKRIEDTFEYPGKIKVTALRETKAVEYAI